MRHESIMSYELIDGRKTGMRDEGELVRCGDCRYSYTDKHFGGLYCKGKRISPQMYCSWGMRKDEERDLDAGHK